MNKIHLDEKWFSLSKIVRRLYLVDSEEKPHRIATWEQKIQDKGDISCTCPCAVAEPQHDTHHNRLFNGKIGIWPFIFLKWHNVIVGIAPRGKMETKYMQSTDKSQIKKMLQEKVLLDIWEKSREKWPLN